MLVDVLLHRMSRWVVTLYIGMEDRWDMERELAGSSVQTFSQHADRCVKSAVIRANLHDGVVGDMASAFRAGGNVVVLEETYNRTKFNLVLVTGQMLP